MLVFLLLAVAEGAQFASAVRSAAILPGLDVLSGGYDAATWNEMSATKARIFAFGEPTGQIHVGSLNRTYNVPPLVSVNADGPNIRRVEDSCEGVDSTFASYLKTHQSSTSLDVGIATKNFSLGLQYHKDVEEVYEAIDSEGQAIGTSESWWGMFEVTLPPPFLMTKYLDPMFAQAKAVLASIGSPATEADQDVYNEVCCGSASFGTHYIGSVIVGARATVTTFVNNSFHKRYSEKVTSEQISIGFEWKKLKASLNYNASDVEKKLMQSFRNSSHSRLTWQPDSPAIHASPAPWLAWLDAAVDDPVVINVSAASLAHVFFDYPAVQAHMQRTIDWYVANNAPPTLADLAPTDTARLKEVATADAHSAPAAVPGLHHQQWAH